MTYENYSLCITVIEIGQNNNFQLLRLADTIGKDGELDEKSLMSNSPDIKTIIMDPNQTKNNDLAIWKWGLDSVDKKQQWSKRTNERFYELIFLYDEKIDNKNEIKNCKIEDLIDVLISGFKIPQFITDNLLLVLGKDKDKEYICFNLEKSDYSIENNIMKIKEGTTLDIYTIKKEHCIDTNYLKNATPYYPYIQNRIIYKERILKEPEGQVKIKSFLSLFKSYFEKITEQMNYNHMSSVKVNFNSKIHPYIH